MIYDGGLGARHPAPLSPPREETIKKNFCLTHSDNILNLKQLLDIARLLFWQASEAVSYGEEAVMNRRPKAS